MDYIIGIPSYKRANNVLTIDLFSHFVPQSNIVVSTQTEEDFEAYQVYSDRATIIYNPGTCVGDNRNTLLEYCQSVGMSKIIMLDDDIKGIKMHTGRCITDAKTFVSIIDYCFNIAEKNRSTLFGTYPCDNSFFMKNKIEQRNLITGTMFGILDTNLRFNRIFKIKEDYELALRVINKGGNCIRFCNFSPIAKHKTIGGCGEQWKQNNDIYAQILVEMYPHLCKLNKNKQGEILFVK